AGREERGHVSRGRIQPARKGAEVRGRSERLAARVDEEDDLPRLSALERFDEIPDQQRSDTEADAVLRLDTERHEVVFGPIVEAVPREGEEHGAVRARLTRQSSGRVDDRLFRGQSVALAAAFGAVRVLEADDATR